VVADASDLGACVCEDDATVSELDDLRVRVVELRDAWKANVAELAEEYGARVRVQAEQIAALQEALQAAQSVCETLPGKLAHKNWQDALTEIEWLAAALALAEGCAAPAGTLSDEAKDEAAVTPPVARTVEDGPRTAPASSLNPPADEEEK
jgi:hypothetical protein